MLSWSRRTHDARHDVARHRGESPCRRRVRCRTSSRREPREPVLAGSLNPADTPFPITRKGVHARPR